MLGINGLEFVVLALLAVVILGPERLPEYASQLARLVKGLRRMATGAREQLREEVGPELDEVDWRKLDPRQYDPRRIIREALLEDFDDVLKPVSSGAPAPVSPAGIRSATQAVRLSAGQSAPYDAEAT